MSVITVTLPTARFVENVRTHPGMLSVLRDTHRFIMLRWHRRARKTTLGLNRLILSAASTANELYAYIGPTYKQAKATILQDPRMLRTYLPTEALVKPFNESELIGKFHTGSVLMVKGADDPDSLRGIRFKGVVLDEFAMQKPEVFTEILLPTLTETHGWALLPFTPKGRNHAWEFYRRCGHSDAPDWAQYTLRASQSGLLSDADLAQVRQEMGDDLYAQEMECEFLESARTAFKGLEACVDGQLEPPRDGHRYVLGVDLGRSRCATVLTVMDCDRRHVVSYDRLTNDDWAVQKQAIASRALQYHAPIVIDATGFSAGNPIAEDLQHAGFTVEPFTFTEQSKRTLVEGLRVAIAQRLITFPKVPQLYQELTEFEITLDDRGKVFYGCPPGEGFFDDSVMSLALAVHGLKGDLYVATPSETLAAEYETALAEIPVNGGMSFR